MRYCPKCDCSKAESSFPSASWSDLCSDCALIAKERFYKRVRAGETVKEPRIPKHLKRRAPKRPVGSVLKRCPDCNANVWVIQTDETMCCWKCGKDLRIAQALCSSAHHRHGVILSVLP